jgi:hypothetical protein
MSFIPFKKQVYEELLLKHNKNNLFKDCEFEPSYNLLPEENFNNRIVWKRPKVISCKKYLINVNKINF